MIGFNATNKTHQNLLAAGYCGLITALFITALLISPFRLNEVAFMLSGAFFGLATGIFLIRAAIQHFRGVSHDDKTTD